MPPLPIVVHAEKTSEITDNVESHRHSVTSAYFFADFGHRSGLPASWGGNTANQDGGEVTGRHSVDTPGNPAEKKLEEQYGTTELHWTSKPGLPDVFVTESQGIMKIIYQPPLTRINQP